MPRFEPFRGLRYDEAALAAVGETMADVVAPPYDVIDASERGALEARSPHNSVLVELPAADPARGLNPYEAAKARFDSWLGEGILKVDPQPGFYAYRMTFADQLGRSRQTSGVVGALEVTEPGRGDVLPHEETMPKPKGDRLELLRATRTNTSPVWGLSLASGLADVVGTTSSATVETTDSGVHHELWPISSARHVDKIRELVSSSPVVIADGHHRYETALVYRDERRAARDAGVGHELVMAFVVELADHELTVRPIHRLLLGLPRELDVAKMMRAAFDLAPAGPPGPALLREMEQHAGLALVTREGAWLLEPRPETIVSAGLDLDSSRLELALEAFPPHDVDYEPDLDRAMAAVEAGRASAAVLLRPAGIQVISRAAWTRERMPPKTTFFEPKPRTGMVFRNLDHG